MNHCSIRSTGLAGQIIPVSKRGRFANVHTTEINAWVSKHPRILDLLGRWGNNNPQKQLNSADYLALETKMDKVEALVRVRDQIVRNEKSLSDSGVSQNIIRQGLSQIAGVRKDEGKAPAPKI